MSEATDETPEEDEQPSLEGLPKSGELLAGKYRIDRLIGQGGMGAVYVANHELLNQPVAVKLLLPEVAQNDEAVARFTNEARASARIRNEHVAQVMDVGKLENGSAYMVLEYLDGSDLAELLEKEGELPIEDAVDYTLQALEAVAQAHALGIIHRDLKPANLFLARRQDGSKLIKVLDFGISKATNPLAGGGQMTSTKALLGSPGYMSPEQVRSSKHVDIRTDIWSMGVILYRLLTDVAPFDGSNLGAVFAAILEEDPPKVRHWRPEISEGLEAVVVKCLARNRDARYQNAAELAIALAPFTSLEASLAVDRICRTLGVAAPHRAAQLSRPDDGRATPPPELEASGERLGTTGPHPAAAAPATTAAVSAPEAASPAAAPPAVPAHTPIIVRPSHGPAGTVVMTPGQPLLPAHLQTPPPQAAPKAPVPAPLPATILATSPPLAPPVATPPSVAPPRPASTPPARSAPPPTAPAPAPAPAPASSARGAIIAVAIAALVIGGIVTARYVMLANSAPARERPERPERNALPEIPPRPAGTSATPQPGGGEPVRPHH